ncbi:MULTISPECIES: hypothetical protein [Saccharibacillus]|uniref:hypothetical protein n=1 Tax=Saccharibacillus TaxID=456492 RepID=UPI001238C7AA|nr:hypothetical protein [Saccharibacillus sp. WB 17]MWJ31408.1 hypothetical protein [Saccharibacillus sp. WB 17]
MNGTLELVANGGDGGRGQDGGDGAPGADGAKGDDAETYIFSSDKEGEPGKPGGNGGGGGSAGASGQGGNGGLVFVGSVVQPEDGRFALTSEGGRAGENALPGKGQAGGKGGQGGLKLYTTPPSYGGMPGTMSIPITIVGKERASTGQDGEQGQDGQAAAAANAGYNGSIVVATLTYEQFYGVPIEVDNLSQSDKARVEEALCASLEQKMLTLNKANVAYLSGEETNIEEAVLLLQWLYRTVPDEAALANLRSLPKENGAHLAPLLEASVQWLALRNRIVILLSQITQGLDYFGHPWNWVPLLPLGEYQERGRDLIDAAQQAEQLYRDYLQAQDRMENRVYALKHALDLSADSIAGMEKSRENTIKTRIDLKKTVDGMMEKITAQEAVLQKEAAEFVELVRKQLAVASLKEMFNLIVNGVALVTNVGPAITALRTGGAIASAIGTYMESGKTIAISEEGKDQNQVDKEKKKKEAALTKSVGNVTKTLSSGIAVITNVVNLVDLTKRMNEARDSFGYKSTMVTMKREEFEAMLKPVYNQIAPEKVEAYRTAFYTYLNIVEDYQSKIQSYKATYFQEGKTVAEIMRIRAEDERIRQALGNQDDPSLPLFHTYVFNMYNELKENLIDFLYQEYQAFRYSVLRHDRFPKLRDNHVAELSRIHADITGKLTSDINRSDASIQDIRQLKVILNESSFPDQFAMLRERKQALFPVSLDNPAVRQKLAGKAHIMVNKVKFELPGVQAGSGEVHIEYSHSGYSAFLSRDAQRYDFVHQRIRGFYEYSSHDGTDVQTSGGNIGDGLTRIMPGLLTLWSIALPQTDSADAPLNEGVDLQGMKQIVMTFEGTAEPFAEKAPTSPLDRLKVKGTPITGLTDDDELFLVGESVAESSVEHELEEELVIEL